MASEIVLSTLTGSLHLWSFMLLISPDFKETISTVAPAFFNAFTGLSSSDCSYPSVAKTAIFLFSKVLINILFKK